MSDETIQPTPSRYQRVQAILDQAAGDSTADYQGFGPFWQLPYDEFIRFKIYDIPLIATGRAAVQPGATGRSAGPASACGCEPTTDSVETPVAAATSSAGRGASSGLVRGLRGEWPFDGSHFPRLPWGGTAVSASDIRFIESWIEEGYPETDHASSTEPPKQPPSSTPGWRQACPGDPANEPANDFHWQHGQALVRKNYEYLSDEELCRLRFAIRAVKKLNAYPADNRSFDAWARVHGDHCQHGWEQFFPWHRAYLYKFELALQQIVPGVSLPYWDWTLDTYNGGAVPAGKQSGIIPTGLRCFLDAGALASLRDNNDLTAAVVKKLSAVENQLFNSTWELFCQAGLSADEYRTYSPPVVAQLMETNPLWHPYRYPGMFYDTDSAGNPQLNSKGEPQLSSSHLASAFHQHYPRTRDIEQILAIDNWHDFGGGHFANQSYGVLDQGPHNLGHIWSGGQNPFYRADANNSQEPQYGDMIPNLTGFFDPIAYAHHSNVDRLFRRWQEMNPGLGPDDPTDTMVPFDLTVGQVLDITKLGYEYARTSKAWRIDSGQEISRLATEPAGLPDGALGGHRKVELRFHNLRRPVRSYVVRVFLNHPDADAETPVLGNQRFAGYFARFGHGDCVGGPGHCDPPRPPVSRFEKPSRPHNALQNHRLDITDCVARLLAEGENDLSVRIVALDGNGRVNEGIKMDGVSIHILD